MNQESIRSASWRRAEKNQGYAAITATMVVLVLSLTLLTSFSFFTLSEVQGSRLFRDSIEARTAAEGGVEDMLYRAVTGRKIDPLETSTIGSSTITATLTTAGSSKTLQVASARGSAQQRMEARIFLVTTNAKFFYGAQVGEGGLTMENNSRIEGSVFSNGTIAGDQGVTITGDAFAAGTTTIKNITVNGNAHASRIEQSTIGGSASSTTKLVDVIVGKDAHADELVDTKVNRDAYYRLIDRTSVVLGSRFPGSQAPAQLEPLPLPISDETVAKWKQDAAGLGTISSGTCANEWTPPQSPYTVSGGVIERTLKLTNNQVLILKGTVFVKCNVDISNGATIRLDPVYGDASGVLIADGWMHLQNTGAFQGSGKTGSYLMLLSTATGGGHHGSAMDLHNNATGAIFYAGHGMIFLHNNVEVTELVGNTVSIDNSAGLVYERGLENVMFSAGPGGGYDIIYWKRVE